MWPAPAAWVIGPGLGTSPRAAIQLAGGKLWVMSIWSVPLEIWFGDYGEMEAVQEHKAGLRLSWNHGWLKPVYADMIGHESWHCGEEMIKEQGIQWWQISS